MKARSWAAPAALAALLIFDGSASASRVSREENTPRPGSMREESGRQGWLGIYLENLSALSRSALGLGEDQGVIIGSTVEGSVAEKAGLKRGDVLLRVDGAPVSSDADVREQLRGKAGQEVNLDLLRAAKPLTIKLTAGDRVRDAERPRGEDEGMPEPPDVPISPDTPEAPGREVTVIVGAGAWLGVEPQDLGRELGEAFGVSDGKGVLLAKVLPGSPAEKAGLKAGDVIIRLDGKSLDGESDLRKALNEIHGQRTVEVTVVRKKEVRKFSVQLKGRPDWRIGPMNMPDLGQWHWNFREGDRTRLRDEMRRMHEELDRLKSELQDLRVHIKQDH